MDNKYCVWADGTSCLLEELEYYLNFGSDDYFIVDITDEVEAQRLLDEHKTGLTVFDVIF